MLKLPIGFLMVQATPLVAKISKDLTKWAILPDFKHPQLLCLALLPCQTFQKNGFLKVLFLHLIVSIYVVNIISIFVAWIFWVHFLKVCWLCFLKGFTLQVHAFFQKNVNCNTLSLLHIKDQKSLQCYISGFVGEILK